MYIYSPLCKLAYLHIRTGRKVIKPVLGKAFVTPSMEGAIFRIYRGNYRWTLFFLTVCLFVSSFYAPLTVKNFLIITVAFIATATTAIKSLEFFTEGHGVVLASVAKIATLAFLAGGFPFLINWNPKSVFSKGSDSHD